MEDNPKHFHDVEIDVLVTKDSNGSSTLWPEGSSPRFHADEGGDMWYCDSTSCIVKFDEDISLAEPLNTILKAPGGPNGWPVKTTLYLPRPKGRFTRLLGKIQYEATGEFRHPKNKEWYMAFTSLDPHNGMVWEAEKDFDRPFWIMKRAKKAKGKAKR